MKAAAAQLAKKKQERRKTKIVRKIPGCLLAHFDKAAVTSCFISQEQSNKAESLVRLYDGIANAAEALGRLAGEELRGAQAEHLEEEAAAKVCTPLMFNNRAVGKLDCMVPYARRAWKKKQQYTCTAVCCRSYVCID